MAVAERPLGAEPLKRSGLLWVGLLLGSLSACGGESPWVAVSTLDERVQYTGRVDRSRSAVEFAYPGTTARLRFWGEGVAMLLKDRGQGGPAGINFYEVSVDGRPPVVLEARPELTRYVLAKGLGWGAHTVEVTRRTEGLVGPAQLLGFELQGELLEPPPRPRYRMEVIGDAMACGYGVEVRLQPPPYGDPTTGFHSANQNHQRAFGALAAKRLGTELVTVCGSGKGVLRNEDESTTETVGELFERTLPDTPELRWDFSQYVPDVVVINAGTSDFAPESPFLTESPLDDQAFQLAYEQLVLRVREVYPQAHIICTTGVMLSDYFPQGRQQLTRLQALVSGTVRRMEELGDGKVHYLAFSPQRDDYYGEDWHPSAEAHRAMANELSSFMLQVTRW